MKISNRVVAIATTFLAQCYKRAIEARERAGEAVAEASKKAVKTAGEAGEAITEASKKAVKTAGERVADWQDPGLADKRVFVDIKEIENAEDVVAHFGHATHPSLWAAYGTYYPNFVWREKAVEEISKAVDEERNDPNSSILPHRLDVLSAVTAAHAPLASPETRAGLIVDALNDERREVKEIIIQNLITTVPLDQHGIRNFSLDRQILPSLQTLINDCSKEPSLTMPLCLCVQYLLLLDHVLDYLQDMTYRNEIQSLLAKVLDIDSNTVPHFWYAQKLIRLHRNHFRNVVVPDYYALPPQLSEALLRWETLRSHYPEYLRHLALIWARMTFTITGARELPSSKGEGLPERGLSFIKHFDLLSLLPEATDALPENMPQSEKADFGKWLVNSVRDRVHRPEVWGYKKEQLERWRATLAERALAGSRPFPIFSDPVVLQDVANQLRTQQNKILLAYMISVLAGITTGIAFLSLNTEASGADVGSLCSCLYHPEGRQLDFSGVDLKQILEDSANEAVRYDTQFGARIEELDKIRGQLEIEG